jgi:hypothetical protein
LVRKWLSEHLYLFVDCRIIHFLSVFFCVGVVGIGQDITDARAKRDAEMKQRAAEAATAAQATISAHVYHEIRNVVGSVLALAGM